MPHLQFERQDTRLFVHTLRPGRTVLGRSDRCDIALPADGISRVHCILEQRADGWWLTDRSKHGVRVNGVEQRRTRLSDGDRIAIGPYEARFGNEGIDGLRAPTATVPLTRCSHEEWVQLEGEQSALGRASLRVTDGPLAGTTFPLERSRLSIGGPESTIVLDDALPKNALWLRVVRGRVMVEPGASTAHLAGARVRDLTPALVGEELRVANHRLVIEHQVVEETHREREVFADMVGTSNQMSHLFGILQRMAQHDAPVLIIGESGTGKELAARGLHDAGPRAEGPFVPVNCAAIAESLFESELFGHEKGSFTGASQRQDGAFHHAHTGTLFLDEIGELKLDLQAKLLRALETGEVKRLGAATAEFPDIRLVAATNRNLAKMVREGTFREDLYFRLSVLPVRTPPLRERRDDIPLLARTLLGRNHPGTSISREGVEALMGYDWPGNVRELRNVLTRAVVLHGSPIRPSNLTFNPWAFEGSRRDPGPLAHVPDEKATLEATLKKTNGNRTAAARLLGMPRSSLLYKLRKHGLM